jgi:Flp pilus assembly protein TadG
MTGLPHDRERFLYAVSVDAMEETSLSFSLVRSAGVMTMNRLRRAGQWSSRSFALGLKSERGGSLVEFALVLPMMMVLITGMYSFGLALSSYMVLTNAVSAGARAFAISPAVTVNVAGGKTAQISDPCDYAVQMAKVASPTIPAGAVTYTITYTFVATGKSTTYTYPTTCNNLATTVGDNVQVQGVYNYNLLLYGFKPGSVKLQARSAELVQ